ncbi:MAG TPA: AAA family ATPase [Jatrophihabitantaceae bacterium]
MLVERERETAEFDRLIRDALEGHGRLVFLGGEAGVGKSSLVRDVIETARGRSTVRCGYADDVTTAAALGALLEAAPELARVTDDIAARGKLSLFHAARELLAREPTLLVLEDVHWADEATLDVVRYLGRRLEGMPLLVVATYRHEDVPPRHRLAVVMGDLAAAAGVVRMDLTPLSTAGVARLVEAAELTIDPTDLHGRTGGNPFFVTEVLAAGAATVPTTVRDAVLARSSRLTPAAQHVLAGAAVLGTRVDPRTLALVVGEPESALDECIAHGVLVVENDECAFRHELARLAVLETLSGSERSAVHRAALHELLAGGSTDARAIAYHAAGCAEWEVLLRHARIAARRAADLGAHHESAAQYRMALRVPHLALRERAELADALAYECYLTDQLPEALAAMRQAADAYEVADDAAALGAAQRRLSRLTWFLGQNVDSERYAEKAIAALEPLGDGHELGMAYSNMSQLMMLAGNTAATTDWGRRALAVAARIGDREIEIHALNNVGTATCEQAGDAEGLRMIQQSLALALEADAHEHAARAFTNLGSVATRRWRLAEAEERLDAGIAYCDDRDLDSWSRYMSGWRAIVFAERGDYDEALALSARILGHADLAPISRIQAALVLARVSARRQLDHDAPLAEATELAAETGESQRMLPATIARAEVAWLTGDTGAVGELVTSVLPMAATRGNPWQLGELLWWAELGGVHVEPPAQVAPVFELMLAGVWDEAAEAWRELGCPLWVALAKGCDPDLRRARESLIIVSSLGAPGVAAAIARTRFERNLAVARGPRTATRRNAALLTPREVEVLALVARGLTNAEIGRRLFLSTKTVGHHISSILRKLGEPSRGRAVAAAREQGIGLET